MSQQNYMTAEHLDVFKELGNIGAGNATSALAQLMGKSVNMAVPQAKIVSFDEIGAIMGGPETIVTSGLIELSDDMNGFVLLIMNTQSSLKLVKTLLGTDDVPASPLDFDELQLSTLGEVTNILVGAYMTAIGSMTGLVINLSVPHMTTDMAAAIMSVPAMVFGQVGDTVLFIETMFDDEDEDPITGHFFLVPDAESCNRLLTSLGLEA